jgi:hypothetical protein
MYIKKSSVKIISFLVAALLVCLQGCGPDKQKSIAASTGFNSVFFNINAIKVPNVNPDSLEQTMKQMESVNLTDKSRFWPGHDHFFMNSVGSIDFSKAGSVAFRLTVRGKIIFRLNNKDLFRTKTPTDTVAENSQFVDAGKNMFEMEYFDGGLDPRIVLEWSPDGKDFEPVPAEMFGSANLSLDSAQYAKAAARPSEVSNQMPNVLSKEEIAGGWKLLFDGTTTKGWHTFNHPGTIGRKWHAEDGSLVFDGRERFRYMFEGRMMEMGDTDKAKDGGLDIVTDGEFENFELKLEWKISKGGNNGILYTVLEDPKYKEAWNTSPEMQVLDDLVHKDGLIYKHRSGDLYDLIACSEVTVRPQGEWNSVKIVKNNGLVEHWQNGVKVVEYDLNAPAWKEMISRSKFSKMDNFATPGKRKISFQDHDNLVSYRNIRIHELK